MKTTEKEVKVVKPIELVELIKQDKPGLLGKMPDKRAAAVIRATLTKLRSMIDELNEGVIKLPGFGSFVVHQVVRKKGDAEVTVGQVVFRAAKKKTD